MREVKQFISVNELAKMFDLNKSHIFYYRNIGLLKEVTTVGKMLLFEGVEAPKQLEEILESRKKK